MPFTSPRTDDVLECLTSKIRLLTTGQIARTWFAHTEKPTVIAAQYVRRLQVTGLITISRTMAHPEQELTEPILDWQPGSDEPNFDRLSWKACSRWSEHPVRTTVITATEKARSHTGGPIGGRPIRPLELNHDIGVSTVFLNIQARDPELARLWVHEDALAREARHNDRENLPDAQLDGLVIEFAGAYSAKKLRAVHEHFSKRPYQLW
jgi:hypothetical protein